jgi:hypothetical protein
VIRPAPGSNIFLVMSRGQIAFQQGLNAVDPAQDLHVDALLVLAARLHSQADQKGGRRGADQGQPDDGNPDEYELKWSPKFGPGAKL